MSLASERERWIPVQVCTQRMPRPRHLNILLLCGAPCGWRQRAKSARAFYFAPIGEDSMANTSGQSLFKRVGQYVVVYTRLTIEQDKECSSQIMANIFQRPKKYVHTRGMLCIWDMGYGANAVVREQPRRKFFYIPCVQGSSGLIMCLHSIYCKATNSSNAVQLVD